MKIYFIRISRKRGSVRNVAMDEKTYLSFRSMCGRLGDEYPDFKYYQGHSHGYNLINSEASLKRLMDSYKEGK